MNESLWNIVLSKIPGIPEDIRKNILLYAALFKFLDKFKNKCSFYNRLYSLPVMRYNFGNFIEPDELKNYLHTVEEEFKIEKGCLSKVYEDILEKTDAESFRKCFTLIDDTDFSDDGSGGEYNSHSALRCYSKFCFEIYYAIRVEESKISRTVTGLLHDEDDESLTFIDHYYNRSQVIQNPLWRLSKNNVDFFAEDDESALLISCLTIFYSLEAEDLKIHIHREGTLDSSVKYDRMYSDFSAGSNFPDDLLEKDDRGSYHIAHLKENGKACFLVPMDFLGSEGKGIETIKKMIDSNLIEAVIELDVEIKIRESRMIIFYALIYADQSRTKDRDTILLFPKADIETSEILNDFRNKTNRYCKSITLGEIREDGYDISPGYTPSEKVLQSRILRETDPAKKIEEIKSDFETLNVLRKDLKERFDKIKFT